ncbi:hypothetical protein M426DRAFT_8999 [Hypoxylon sp. CI-4A]|nr:hypothetical protein M426DRAFT_8999 [Hypoxylon sp. CI-4A]
MAENAEDIPPDDEEFQEPERPPSPVFPEDPEDDWIDWESVWRIIIHRFEAEDEGPDEYPAGTINLDYKDPPFPFNLDATWYCAGTIAVLFLVHIELDTEWLLRTGYRSWLIQIAYRAMKVVVVSFVSTLLYEVIGNVLDVTREGLNGEVNDFLNNLLGKRLGWARLDDEGEPLYDPYRQDLRWKPNYRATIHDFATFVLNLAWNFVVVFLPQIILTFGPPTKYLPYGPWKLASAAYSFFSVPVPSPDTMYGFGDIGEAFYEFGLPALFQLFIAMIVYMTVLLFWSTADNKRLAGRRRDRDSMHMLIGDLCRAFTMHIIAYTAYQFVYIIAHSTLTHWHIGRTYVIAMPIQHRVRRFQISPTLGPLIWGAHYIIRQPCKYLTPYFWAVSIYYIMWLSVKEKAALNQDWNNHYRYWIYRDFAVNNQNNRVWAKAVMTSLFGLQSSWPMRMRLSNRADEDDYPFGKVIDEIPD